MKIGIDLRCLESGEKSGVGEYAVNLVENILRLDQANSYLLFSNSFWEKNNYLERFEKYPNVRVKKFHWPNKLLNLCFWYLNWPKIDRMLGGAEVLFLPNLNFAAWSKKTKVILTIHDLSFEYYPETFSEKRRLWHWFINPKKLAGRAGRIIAVSDSTKSDLISRYGVDPSKIKMIHSAAAESFRVLDRNDLALAKIAKKYALPYKFILYLGTIEPRKNISGLIQAYDRLRRLGNPELDKYKLVIAGSVGWKSDQIFSAIENSPYSADIIATGMIASKDMPMIYNLASLFVYPSFFEGFGFPPLEAMACGVPVVTSNNSSLPEVVGDAAILIEPEEPEEIFHAMREVLLNRELSAKLRAKGLEQANSFSWSKTAGEFLKTIHGWQ